MASYQCASVRRSDLRAWICMAIALVASPQLAGWPHEPGYSEVSQRNSTSHGLVAGHVVDANTQKGLAACTVALAAAPGPGRMPMPQGPASRRVITDGQGAFVFGELPSGWYTVQATHASYALSDRAEPYPGRRSRHSFWV